MLTEDPSALRRWIVAGPEVSRMVANYERVSKKNNVKEESHHHEQSPTVQKRFLEEVIQTSLINLAERQAANQRPSYSRRTANYLVACLSLIKPEDVT